jgi:integrase
MPKIAKPLTALAVSKIKTPGWHAVGGVAGLLLQVRTTTNATVAKSWIMRIKIGNERVPLGLGSYPNVTLEEAREQARKIILDVKDGIDPRVKRKAIKSAALISQEKSKTFKECAEAYLMAHAADYSSDKHRKQWETTLRTYAYPIIGNLVVADISMQDIKKVLTQPITDIKTKKVIGSLWEKRTETASRLQGRIKSVFDYAIVSEYRTAINPATWTGYLETQLPAPNKLQKVEHQPAIPYQDIGDFMLKLRSKDTISAKALEFLVLTAVRSGSVREAEWEEIDYENKVWNIPAEHTKTKQEHRVPLSPQAIKLLKQIPKITGNNKIFPSPRGVCLSDNTLSKLMRDMKANGDLTIDAVPHGFRSTFRDWAAEQTAYPDDIRKAASGHRVGDAVQQSYQRTDLLEKRRKLMKEWANFLDKPSVKQQTKVVQLRRKINA